MKKFTILMVMMMQVLAMNAIIIPDEDIIPPDESKPDQLWPMKVIDNIVYEGHVREQDGGAGGGMPDYSKILGVTSNFDTEDLRIEYLVGYPPPMNAAAYAFDNCSSIKTVRFWSGMEGISRFMFQDCINLESVDLSAMSSNHYTPQYTAVAIFEGAFSGCVALKEIKLPYVFDAIYKNAFHNCVSLERIHINESVYIVDHSMPAGELELIGDEAFSGCTGLKYIKLPASLQKIGNNVWDGCVNLQEVLYTAPEPLAVEESIEVFPQVVYDNATLYLSKEYARLHPDIHDGLPYPWNRFQHVEIMDFSAIDEIECDSVEAAKTNKIDTNLPFEVYTINGTRICSNQPIPQIQSLPKGIYLLRQGLNAKKIIIP